jgi:hypothetical protein
MLAPPSRAAQQRGAAGRLRCRWLFRHRAARSLAARCCRLPRSRTTACALHRGPATHRQPGAPRAGRGGPASFCRCAGLAGCSPVAVAAAGQEQQRSRLRGVGGKEYCGGRGRTGQTLACRRGADGAATRGGATGTKRTRPGASAPSIHTPGGHDRLAPIAQHPCARAPAPPRPIAAALPHRLTADPPIPSHRWARDRAAGSAPPLT